MRNARWLTIALAGLFIASACGGGTGGGGTATAVKLTDGKVVIGVINDQSGVYADLSGKNAVEAVNMAVADFKAKYGDNALGGPIEVVSADHKNDPALASSKATEFYERNSVDLILDVPTSSAALAIAKVAGEQKKLYINITAASTDLTGAQCNKYTFHYAYDTYMLAQGTGTAVVAGGGKQWYIIYPNYAFGQDMNKSFSAAVTASGGTVIGSDGSPFPNQTGDFSSLLLKAGQLKPQVLGAMQAGGDLVNVVKQYNEFKLKDQGIKLAIGLLFDTDITALGQDAFAGVQYTTPWIWSQDDAAKAFADKFLAKTKIRPTFAHAANYSATMQYLEAIKRAGSDDPDAVVKALEGYKFNDLFIHNGLIRPEDHWVMHDAFLAQVKSKAESKEAFDYSKVIATIPADKASRPLAEAGCKMTK
jgi:branched-chain amino acid transport system substrate-binding protein